MFVGHLAVALAAKRAAPAVNLGWLIAGVTALDLIWPVFLLAGIEHARIVPGATAFTPLIFESYPWSHSLVMAGVWGLAFAALARLRGVKAPTWLLVALVVSHWLLDVASHAPDMPLWPGLSPRLGTGLWHSVRLTLLIEGTLWLLAIVAYLHNAGPRSRIARMAFWSLVAVTTIMWATSPWSPPPPTVRALGWFALIGWITIPWAALADHDYQTLPLDDRTPLQAGVLLQLAVVLALAPPLVYCAGLLYGLDGRLPWAGPWLSYVAWMGALVGVVVHFAMRRSAAAVFDAAELVLRYGLALLLFQFALNKLIPGQFLLYNRDLDLPLRDLPARRLAWHFLGYSNLYNGFIAAVELIAALLLCSRRTVVGGALLALGALVNIVMIDSAFGLRGALPIATVMACATLGLACIYVDRETLQSLVWRRPNGRQANRYLSRRRVQSIAVAIVIGVPLLMNLAARRGLGRQVSATGRWEVIECLPDPGVVMCQPRQNGPPAVLYFEVGGWGQLVASSERRSVSFSYDPARRVITARIEASNLAREPELVLSGPVAEHDTTVVLEAVGLGVPPFQIRLKRTHQAPWPPVRAY